MERNNETKSSKTSKSKKQKNKKIKKIKKPKKSQNIKSKINIISSAPTSPSIKRYFESKLKYKKNNLGLEEKSSFDGGSNSPNLTDKSLDQLTNYTNKESNLGSVFAENNTSDGIRTQIQEDIEVLESLTRGEIATVVDIIDNIDSHPKSIRFEPDKAVIDSDSFDVGTSDYYYDNDEIDNDEQVIRWFDDDDNFDWINKLN